MHRNSAFCSNGKFPRSYLFYLVNVRRLYQFVNAATCNVNLSALSRRHGPNSSFDPPVLPAGPSKVAGSRNRTRFHTRDTRQRRRRASGDRRRAPSAWPRHPPSSVPMNASPCRLPKARCRCCGSIDFQVIASRRISREDREVLLRAGRTGCRRRFHPWGRHCSRHRAQRRDRAWGRSGSATRRVCPKLTWKSDGTVVTAGIHWYLI